MDKQIQRKKLYRFTLSKIFTLMLLSLFLSGLFLSVTNDLYAFVKKDHSVSFTVIEPLSLSQLSMRLSQEEIVNNPTLFQWYITRKGKKDSLEQFHGTVELNTSMSYRQILAAFLS